MEVGYAGCDGLGEAHTVGSSYPAAAPILQADDDHDGPDNRKFPEASRPRVADGTVT